MRITVKKTVIEKIGHAHFKAFGVSADSIRWDRDVEVDLSHYTIAQTNKLKKLFADNVKVNQRLCGQYVRDINAWLTIVEGGAKTEKIRRLSLFDSMLFEYMKQNSPNKWLYSIDPDDGTVEVRYVASVTYHPRIERARGDVTPAHVDVRLAAMKFGQRNVNTITFKEEDVQGKTVPEALATFGDGWRVETPELRAQYESEAARYREISHKVGKQILVWGSGLLQSDRWSRSTVSLGTEQAPMKAVVDIFEDEDRRERSDDTSIDGDYWNRVRPADHEGDDDDDDNNIGPEDADENQTGTTAPRVTNNDLPLERSIVIFSLTKHDHFTIRASQSRDYAYDPTMGSRLVLPEEDLHLINMLVSGASDFKDIISGKSGGSVILATGSPGTGKTLTAEIYAEVMQRPLYSVQCSQLGTDPDDLEKTLQLAFTRADRWKAILLLDEADVYVSARGSDLKQNAIVGVFLRVLEYYNGVLFLTTNRVDNIDDAISSRCIARLVYQPPTPANQKRIWQILSQTMGIAIPEHVIDQVVAASPKLTGRDVKNLLKLAKLIIGAWNLPAVTPEVVEYVKRFKPTRD